MATDDRAEQQCCGTIRQAWCPIQAFAAALGSTWFGMTLLVLLFVYSSIGSAVPPVRQGVLADWLGWEALRFEMTEMEWFSAPVFVGLVLLFCVSIAVATVRRIPLCWIRLGEWVVHAGIIVMVIGCLIYFGRKVEGDAVVYERSAVILAPGMTAPETLVMRPRAAVTVGTGNDRYRIAVSRMDPRREVVTASGQPEAVTAIFLDVLRSGAALPSRFTRMLVVGHPELTEDLPAGGMGAHGSEAKPPGVRLMDDKLRIDLDYEPQVAYFLDHTAAVFARPAASQEWTEMPLPRMPRYAEHLSRADDVWPVEGAPPPLRPINVEAKPRGESPAGLAGVRFHVVGYLPYARPEVRWEPGGDRLNPVVRFSLSDGKDRRSYDLAAFDPTRNRVDFDEMRFRIEFLWANSPEERQRLTAPHDPRLELRVSGIEAPVVMRLGDVLDKGPVPVPGTDYRIAVNASEVMPDFPLMGEALRGQRDTAVLVNVERGDRSFRRLVYARFEDQSRDLDGGHAMPTTMADPGLRIRFLDPASGGMRLVAGPGEDTCDAVIDGLDGRQIRHTLPIGRATTTAEATVPIRVESLLTHAVQAVRPAIVPRRMRQPMQSVGASMSMLAVDVDDGAATQRAWLPFNQYVFPNASYAYPERFQYGSYRPETVRLSDGRTIELLYSRHRRYLPAAVALERFVLETLPGGQRERDFISMVRFFEGGRWSPVREVRSNQPTEYGGLWFYQAEWDPRSEALTVLGVGNREGIGLMLTGVVLSIVGMCYSFFVKPALLRRRGDARRHPARPDEQVRPAPADGRSGVGGIARLVLMAGLLWTAETVRAEPASLAAADLSAARQIAVQHDGRLKPLDTLAREIVQQIAGSAYVDGQTPVFTYLDLLFNAGAYSHRNLIYVKKARVRAALLRAAGDSLSEADVARIRQTKRFSPAFLALPRVQKAIEELERDMLTTGRDVDLLQAAQALARSETLRSLLLVVPPPGGDAQAPWSGIDEALRPVRGGSVLDASTREGLNASWRDLESAWRDGRAAAVGEAMQKLAAVLSGIEPRLYPAKTRLALECAYYRHNKLMGAWVLYALAFVCLLPAFLLRNGLLRRVGLLAFGLALILHTVSIGVRWYLACRIPVANMFEAVTTAAWSAAAAAWILEVWLRRSSARNLFALGASFCGALALACGYFMTTLLNSNISNPMPILNTIWLKIHVTLILISYALIVVSFVTATLYLVLRIAARVSGSAGLRRLCSGAGTSLAAEEATAALLGEEPEASLGAAKLRGMVRMGAPVWWSLVGCVLLAFLLKDEVLTWAGSIPLAASPGAAVGRLSYVLLLLVTVLAGPTFLYWLLSGTVQILAGRDGPVASAKASPLAVALDAATIFLVNLAFVTLWVGIILGAAWADVSWGRPWGWDPKEVFALNTWLIFVGLIHVRLNVRDRGLWTALLAVAGFLVMMFNWIGVNFFIVGLHSYA